MVLGFMVYIFESCINANFRVLPEDLSNEEMLAKGKKSNVRFFIDWMQYSILTVKHS